LRDLGREGDNIKLEPKNIVKMGIGVNYLRLLMAGFWKYGSESSCSIII
jgi:preprotein translocase subunit Sec61beta